MTFYELLLFLHIAAVTIWLGAGFLVGVLIFGAAREGDRVREAGYHRDVAWLAPRLFIPASLATLIFGILLVADGAAWSFGELWIVLSLLGWLASFCLGFFYFRPEGERIGALVAERGPGDAEAEWRVHRLNVVDRLQLTILFLVLATMVFKPSGDDTGLLVVGALILAAAIAGGASVIRRGPGEPPPQVAGGPPSG
jgi:uncharacterized membrane protein